VNAVACRFVLSELPAENSGVGPAPGITRALEADLDAVMEIERASFPNPWTRQAFTDELCRSWAYLEVLREAATSRIIGFCNYWVVLDELHLLNVAVHPEKRRQGHASLLLRHILAQAKHHRSRVVSLEVRASNVAAQTLYQKFGFATVGRRPRYYPDGEDAVLMDAVLAE
jgi:[ribosomal protein S18]-alanine N-acetyltransferase